jgi:hypothetical protein
MGFHLTWDFSYEISFYERVCFISYGSVNESCALFLGIWGYYKTITLFSFFIKNIFLRRNVNTHAGEGMSLFLRVGKQQ